MRAAKTYRTLLVLIILTMSLTVISCGTAIDVALESNRDKWESLGMSDYQFKYGLFCDCTDFFPTSVVITVINNEVNAMLDLETGEYLEPSDDEESDEYLAYSYYKEKTMDGIFLSLVMYDNPYQSSINYDSEYGFPVSVYIDPDEYSADEEISFTVSDFQELQKL